MATEAQKRAKRNYLKKCQQLNLVIYPTEKEIADKLADMHDKSGYIKDLIRRDIAMEQREEIYFEETESLTTGEVRTMAAAMVEAVSGRVDPFRISVDDARRIVARFMAARDELLPTR